ncbi:MAG: hypothetical protein KAT30_18020, partial [Candidatus Krumholzibacteria bacterium]|nr:hypothetical protein [Candidatus Krumholzibacteria bacterium]
RCGYLLHILRRAIGACLFSVGQKGAWSPAAGRQECLPHHLSFQGMVGQTFLSVSGTGFNP